MIVAVLLLLVTVAIVLIVWTQHGDQPAAASPPDPKHLAKAAADMHRIRRRLQASGLKHDQRRDAAKLKRELAEAFDEES